MEGRGYALSVGIPDLLVNFNIVVEEKKEFRAVNERNLWGNEKVPYRYKESTLIIELVDHEEKQLVWQGYSSGRLKEKAQAIDTNVRASISLIFSEFRFRAS